MSGSASDYRHMARALELAVRGRGCVEPNPMVGCVIAQGDRVIAEGYHQRYGESHAEVEALRLARTAAAGATMYVTLEPCCHHGKTPPCTTAIIQAGLQRVVAAMRDPNPLVRGGGFQQLRAAGIAVDVGLLQHEAQFHNAPYLKLLRTGRPWVMAKWAMTLDGRLATTRGESQWISGSAAREIVHEIRGRVDAILVGRGTAVADDPRLTARPAGPRQATRIVLDSDAQLSLESQLVRSASEAPVMVAAGPAAAEGRCEGLRRAGCEVWSGQAEDRDARLLELLDELGRRRMTNLLVEGGAAVFGSLFDQRSIDEVHAFVAGKLVGGAAAAAPIGGDGRAHIQDALELRQLRFQVIGQDVYATGRC